MSEAIWTVYLSGEIHTDWRERIMAAAEAEELPVEFVSPVTVHADSDDCGAVILGEEDQAFWRDHKGAKINAIRTRTLLERSDIVVVRFGDKYRQWNAAFDAGYAASMGTPLIT
ncbi:MAG: YtoQ family protein, partial [Alphaproteobacteria bacterium]|nr:YtoQ family protein [Alphaproteobacteria bacterium]